MQDFANFALLSLLSKITCELFTTKWITPRKPRYNPAALKCRTEARSCNFLPAVLHSGNTAPDPDSLNKITRGSK